MTANTPQRVDAALPAFGIDTANHAGIRVRGYTAEQMRALLQQVAEQAAEIESLRNMGKREELNLLTQLHAAERAREKAQEEAATERALQRAATELPEGWQVCVFVERGSGWVDLVDPNNEEVEIERSDRSMAEQIDEAISAANGGGA